MTDLPTPVPADRRPEPRRYPKMVVRILGSVFSYQDLPEGLTTEREMIAHVSYTSWELGLKTCLVLGPDRAWYCQPDGTVTLSDQPPRGGMALPPNARFYCRDGTIREGSPRGPIVAHSPSDTAEA